MPPPYLMTSSNLTTNRECAKALLTVIKYVDAEIARLMTAKAEQEVALRKISSETARHVKAASIDPEHGAR